MPSPQLYLFQCGTLRCRVGDLWVQNNDYTPIEIPVPWFLLTHPLGNIVFDGGNAPECISQPLSYWGAIAQTFWPCMAHRDLCIHGLERVGVSPESVRFVIHSHLHSDHTGALGYFPQAEHMVRGVEYEQAAQAEPGDMSGYLIKEICRNDIRWRFIEDEKACVDILGDGTVTAIPTPGHTAGHQSFLVRLKRTGYVILTHDAVFTMAHWNQEAPANAPVSPNASIASIRKLKVLSREYNALIIPGHDPVSWSTVTKAPVFYD
jgi:glyoxylase-like metal-dependent hydrolase (beta-lactamase superfamily II)